MTREEIIQGLQFTIDMFLFDPTTGEMLKEPRNDMDKTTIDACKGAIELLEQQPIIIQCKDCEHGVDYYHEGDCYCLNPKWGLRYYGGSWEFYCADAKRRTDDKRRIKGTLREAN